MCHICSTAERNGRDARPYRQQQSTTTLQKCAVFFEAGSYLRLTDSCITQLKAQGPSRTCKESKEEEKKTEKVSSQYRIRCRAMMEQLTSFHGHLPGGQGKTLALTAADEPSSVRTGSWTGLPRWKRVPRVGISSTVFGVREVRSTADLLMNISVWTGGEERFKSISVAYEALSDRTRPP